VVGVSFSIFVVAFDDDTRRGAQRRSTRRRRPDPDVDRLVLPVLDGVHPVGPERAEREDVADLIGGAAALFWWTNA
jgi:hypothetical protein